MDFLAGCPLTMTDYSQSGEQAAILRSVGDQVGSFLDIGAFSAKDLSNTRALYEKGWSGVLVEPSPGPLKNIIREYGNDERIKIIAGAIGFERKIVRFEASDDGLTTSEPANFKKWQQVGGFYGSFWVPMITLDELLFQFGAFDFVNIDTEGTSAAILKVLLETQMRPRAICVEHDGEMVETVTMATAVGYHLEFLSGENAVLAL